MYKVFGKKCSLLSKINTLVKTKLIKTHTSEHFKMLEGKILPALKSIK